MKTKRTIYRVTQQANGLWLCRRSTEVKGEGPVYRGPRKYEAVKAARTVAKRYPPSQVVVHLGRKHGNRIQIEYTYPRSSDPRRFKG